MPIPGQHLPNHPPATIVNLRGRQLGRMLENLHHLGSIATPFGPQVMPAGESIRFGVTGSGGISARGGASMTAGDVTEYALLFSSGTLMTLTQTSVVFQGFNLSSQPVAANAFTIYLLLWGVWICIWEDCTSMPITSSSSSSSESSESSDSSDSSETSESSESS